MKKREREGGRKQGRGKRGARAASRHRWRRRNRGIDGSASSISVADKRVGVRSIAAPDSVGVRQVDRAEGNRSEKGSEIIKRKGYSRKEEVKRKRGRVIRRIRGEGECTGSRRAKATA